MIFNTASGSRYQVNESEKMVRRLFGTSDPTARQGVDGEWKRYFSLTPPVVGQGVVIIWADEDLLPQTKQALNGMDSSMFAIPTTYTSDVSSIEDE